VNFEEWYDENLKTMLKEHNLHSALEWAWQAAQQAERDRVMNGINKAIKCLEFLESTARSEVDLCVAQEARAAIAKYEENQ
jgi:hypothetical protein